MIMMKKMIKIFLIQITDKNSGTSCWEQPVEVAKPIFCIKF